MEKFIEKYKSYSSKVLQKLAKVKTGDELDAIESILASRGASQKHPAEEGAVYNATETEEYKAENGIKENDEVAEEKPKKARKAKTPKEPGEPRPLKKEISAEEAQANREKASQHRPLLQVHLHEDQGADRRHHHRSSSRPPQQLHPVPHQDQRRSRLGQGHRLEGPGARRDGSGS